ncbi:MAG: hypothetical protein Q7T04_00700 [Dehalococcoidia bacterium]|nr:hypothetical protein [Dehalococcoidia bacterium]
MQTRGPLLKQPLMLPLLKQPLMLPQLKQAVRAPLAMEVAVGVRLHLVGS